MGRTVINIADAPHGAEQEKPVKGWKVKLLT